MILRFAIDTRISDEALGEGTYIPYEHRNEQAVLSDWYMMTPEEMAAMDTLPTSTLTLSYLEPSERNYEPLSFLKVREWIMGFMNLNPTSYGNHSAYRILQSYFSEEASPTGELGYGRYVLHFAGPGARGSFVMDLEEVARYAARISWQGGDPELEG